MSLHRPAEGSGPLEPLSCGYCSHEAVVRDFLTLGDPVRPTVVAVHVRSRTPLRTRSAR